MKVAFVQKRSAWEVQESAVRAKGHLALHGEGRAVPRADGLLRPPRAAGLRARGPGVPRDLGALPRRGARSRPLLPPHEVAVHPDHGRGLERAHYAEPSADLSYNSQRTKAMKNVRHVSAAV